MAHMVYLDSTRPDLVHTRLDCAAHHGLVEAVEHHAGQPVDDPEMFEHLAQELGLMVDHRYVSRGRPCPQCTLVAAPLWRAAA